MLGTKYGFAQSMNPYFVRQSMDFVRNPWIVRIYKGGKYKFADNPWIALRKQLIAWFARRSSRRINYRSHQV